MCGGPVAAWVARCECGVVGYKWILPWRRGIVSVNIFLRATKCALLTVWISSSLGVAGVPSCGHRYNHRHGDFADNDINKRSLRISIRLNTIQELWPGMIWYVSNTIECISQRIDINHIIHQMIVPNKWRIWKMVQEWITIPMKITYSNSPSLPVMDGTLQIIPLSQSQSLVQYNI